MNASKEFTAAVKKYIDEGLLGEAHKMLGHVKHGRGTTEDGPDDAGCACWNTADWQTCAEAGCGFCIAARDRVARQPKPGDPFIDHLRFSASAGEKITARVTVATCDALDTRFRTVTDDPNEKYTADADLDEPAYSEFVNDAISKAIHEAGEPGTFNAIGIFHTPRTVLRLLHDHGVEKGTEIVNRLLEYTTRYDAPVNTPGQTTIHVPLYNAAMANSKKCVVHGCTNKQEHGNQFVYMEGLGAICVPCWNMITTGKIGPSDNFIADLKAACDESTKDAVKFFAANTKLLTERDRARDDHSHTLTTVETVRDVISNMIVEGRIKGEDGMVRGSLGYALTKVPLSEIMEKGGLK